MGQPPGSDIHKGCQASNHDRQKDPEKLEKLYRDAEGPLPNDHAGGEGGSRQDEKSLLKWNASWRTTFKSLATFYSMLLLGLNDAVYGVRSCL